MWRWIVPACIVASLAARAQTPGAPAPDALARVGAETITAGEFLARYALTIFPSKDAQRRGNAVRWQFLYSLVAERLLAMEARRRGIDREQRYTASLRQAERRFVRDRLYRERVRPRAAVTAREIDERVAERRRRVECHFLFSGSEDEIRALSRLLATGTPFDTLLAARQAADSSAATAVTPETERVEPELAAAMRALAPGGLSAPVRTPAGWYILRKARAPGTPAGLEQERREAERELRAEREAEAAVAYVRSLWKGRRAELNDSAYRRVGQALLEDARRAAREARAEDDALLAFSDAVFDTLRARFAGDPGAAFATIGPLRYSVAQFLDDLQEAEVRFRASGLRRFSALFRTIAGEQLDRFLVTEEGYSAGLQESDAVRADVAVWARSGLAQGLSDAVWEQFIASDDSVLAFLAAHPGLAPALAARGAGALRADSTAMRQLRDSVEQRARASILARKIRELVVAGARTTPVEVDDAALRALDADPGAMYTIRFLGFGGRMPAMPGVAPLFDAVLEGLDAKAGIAP